MGRETTLTEFHASLQGADVIERLRGGLIGDDASFDGPFGAKHVIYADYIASGRPLKQIESFILERILPYYANSHTESSFCGAFMTRLRREARAVIASHCGADERFSTVFTGSGATAGLNRIVSLLGVEDAVRAGRNPLVLVGPYEHHSNLLPWRETGAEVIEIDEAAEGGPDLALLEAILTQHGGDRLTVGAFSAASNVTGIVTDTDSVSEVLKRHGALVVWDYAGGAPYLPIDMRAGTPFEKDAIAFSPHKFVGGPGASGVMIVRNDAVIRTRPVFTGGGTVRFVSSWNHDYSEDVAEREEAGTPNAIGDIRAAMAIMVKEAITQEHLDARHDELRKRALAVWSKNENITILQNPRARRCLPFFSLVVRDSTRGGELHPQLFTRLLSDCHGIQARGGCSCAGPYGHRLLGISRQVSAQMRNAILSGEEFTKPGWTRLNLSALMTDEKVDLIIRAVDVLARSPYPMAEAYRWDRTSSQFVPVAA